MIKRFLAFLGMSLLLVSLSRAESAQQRSDFTEVSTGEGTLISSDGDKLPLNAVAVFLRQNGQAEIWLMTATKNVYAGGRWGASTSRTVALEITDDTEGCDATGCGTIFLQAGCMPVARLRMAISKSDGIRFEADFIATNVRSCLDFRAGFNDDRNSRGRSQSMPLVEARFPAAIRP